MSIARREWAWVLADAKRARHRERARFGSRRFISLRPQLKSADGLLTVVRSTFVAS